MALPRRNFPACPNCEGKHLRSGSTGAGNDGAIPIRRYTCKDCGYTGITFEGWLPPTASLNSLDEDRRLKNTEIQRARRGNPQPDKRQGGRITSDRILYYATIEPGRLQPGLAKRLDSIKRANRITPFDEHGNARTPDITKKPTALELIHNGYNPRQAADMLGLPPGQVQGWARRKDRP